MTATVTTTVSEGDGATEETSATGDPNLPSNEDLQAYVEATTSDTVGEIEDSLRFTAKGSLAHAYATYLVGNSTAVISSGDAGLMEQATVTPIENGFEACYPSEPNDCNEYTDFEGENGLIVDHKVNGEPLRGNVIVGDGKPQQAGNLGTIELVAARVNSEGNLFVVLNVRSASQPVQVGWGSSSYRNKDGRQVESEGSGVFGPLELGPDSLGTVRVAYANSDLGGTLTFPLFADDFYNEQAVTFQL
ncbi:hypothetical protein [Nocardioides antri]|uniref:Uncharacterized protein n=1 Tax=Nocardioides antri TaxID=2607659 RepID=A0A5B1LX50_9ACTN|nr:hypothetical protein [Nocardioides antri]KAA1424319.1 hypothetical protein F0U47_18980 [Nocardioides antri]